VTSLPGLIVRNNFFLRLIFFLLTSVRCTKVMPSAR
jgi:hypothetical protein